VGKCGFCTVLACPPHPTQFSFFLSLSLSLRVQVQKPLPHWLLSSFVLCFLCYCLCLLLLLPLLSTCKWGRNHTLNFLLLFDTPLFFFSSFSPLAGYPSNSKHDFLVVFYNSIHPLPFLSCFCFVGTPQKYEFLTMI
jgi:hypothetical protein